jgi:hypothetical protein
MEDVQVVVLQISQLQLGVPPDAPSSTGHGGGRGMITKAVETPSGMYM